MKIVKHYWFIAVALIAMIGFSSCESDEERGFDISGMYGKTWYGDLGFEDPYGEPLYSYITFTSGASSDHGVGTEERCYYDDELYRIISLIGKYAMDGCIFSIMTTIVSSSDTRPFPAAISMARQKMDLTSGWNG